MSHKTLDPNKAIVLFSGGQDSTTVLGQAIKENTQVIALGFFYGQTHSVELQQARLITRKLGIPYHLIDVAETLRSFSSMSALTNRVLSTKDVNEDTGLPSTFLPGRNILFLTLAASLAYEVGAQKIYTGVCQTDYSGYPDCRESFVRSMETSLARGLDADIELVAPLMYLDKAQTFDLAEKWGILDIVLEHSHTCYEGDRSTRHTWGYGCGECPACQLRKNGYDHYLNPKF